MILIVIAGLFITAVLGIAVFIMLRPSAKKTFSSNKTRENNDSSVSAAQDFLPFDKIKNSVIHLGNHKYRMVISCSGINVDLMSSAEQDMMEMSFRNVLSSLTYPVTMFTQTRIIDNGARLNFLKGEADKTLVTFPNMEKYAKQYLLDMQHLNEKIGNSQQKLQYVIIPYDEADLLDTLSDEEKEIYAMKELRTRCEIFMHQLEGTGVRCKILDTGELLKLIYSAYHRSNFAYADEIESGAAFSTFVDGEVPFENPPAAAQIDLLFAEFINKLQATGLPNTDQSAHAVFEEIEKLRDAQAGYYKADQSVQ